MRLFFRRFTALVLMLIMILNILPLNLFAAYPNFGKLPDRYNLPQAAAVPDNKTGAAGFSDITGHWAAPAIGTWSSLGILKGYNGLFRPDDALTRAELTAVLARIIGFSGTGSNPFTDVSADKWYYDAVSKLAAAGILVGFGGLARPEAKITREEAAVMIVRAFGIPETDAYVRPFKDKNRISPWAADSVRRLQAAGCLSGRPDGTFDPRSFMTRAEFIALIDNILRIFKDLREKFRDILDGLRPARDVTVTFNPNGGTFPGGGSDSISVTVSSGQTLGSNMPVPYKENMTFAGWFTDDGTFLNEVKADTPITSDMTLYACYHFIVTFHPNGGSDISPVGISSGQPLGTMPVPYMENRILAGWFTDDGTFLNEVTAGTPIVSNMDLYASYLDAAVLNETNEQDYASVSDAAPDFSMTVLSTEPMTSGEVKDFITVECKSGDKEEFAGISVTEDGSGRFTVAAAEGFKPGCSYALILTDDALTFEGRESRVRTFNLTIAAPDPVLNLRFNPDVKMIPVTELSDITQNGEPADSIFAPLYDMGGEPVEEIYGTFTYNGSQELALGDSLAIYDTTAPDERTAGADYSDDNVAYVTVTGINGTAVSYSNAKADDVLFTPDILPVNIEADTDGDENNHSITVPIGELTFSGEDFAEMGLDSSTVIDIGDFLAFYEGTLPDDADVTEFAEITHVMSDEEVYVITYISVTEEELHASMDMASSRTLTYDQLTENTDIAMLEHEVEQQVTASGFAGKAADFLMNLAALDEDTRNQIVHELGIKDYRMTGNAVPVLLAAGEEGTVGTATAPEITVDVTINRDVDHFDTDSGLNCDITVTCSIDLSEDVNITVTGTFEQEIGVDFDISSEAVWKWWGPFPYIADYIIDASLDVYSYTGLSLNASLTSGSQPDLNIQEEIEKLKETSDNSVTPEKKSDAVREFYEIYQEMLALNHDYIDLINVPLISVSGWVDPLYIIAFSFKTDFVVSVDVALSMGAEFGYVKATRYSVTLKLFSGTATSSQTDLVDNDYGFTLYIMGTIGLRAGLRMTVEVGLFSTNLDSIGFTAEVGAYWRIWGFAYYQLSHHDDITERHSAGACYMELGVYLEVNFIAQLGQEAFSYVATLYEHEWPLLTIGSRYYVFDFNYETDDSTDDIAIKFIDSYRLPATIFKMYHMDFYNGLISEKVYPAENFDLKITDNNTYNGFVARSNGDILINQPSSVVHKLSAKLSVTWKEQPLSFTSAPLIRTYSLAWDDLDDSYYIRFEPNGGSCIPMIVAEYNAVVTLPTPVLQGYVFQGWYRVADNTLYANKDNLTINMRTDNPTVYAKWETGAVRYTVYHWEQQYDGTYKRFYPSTADTGIAYTGSSITPTVVSRNERISPAPQTVTVAGDGSTFVEYFYDLPVCTLTFDPDPAESGDEVTLTGRYGTMVPEPIFVNNGFSVSWNPAPSCPYPGYVGFLKDETYSAIWTPILYTISYNEPSGSLPAGSNPSSYYVYDEFTLVNPTSYPGRDDLRFAGWTGTGLSAPTETVTIHNGSTGNRFYQAVWVSLYRNISYNLAGGVLPAGESNPSQYYVNSDDITLVNPARDGYIFLGWTGTGLDAPTMTVTIPKGSEGDRQYTAQWIGAYTISYDLAGGVMPQGVSNPPQYSSQSPDFTLVNPVKDGYVFTGWTGTGLSEPTLEVTVPQGSAGNRAYTACWAQLANYTVIHMKQQYQPGNGLGYIQQELEVLSGGERLQTAAEAKTYAGYDIQPFEQETIAPSGATVVYIYYNLKRYTATFDANGGEGGTTQSVIYTLPITAPASPTRTGYTFAGWDPEIPAAMPMEDITFTAQWTPVTYSIAYDTAGGSVEGTNPTSYTIESPDITLINPTREGYDFAGWTGTGLGGPTADVTITTGSAGNRTYTATWTPKDGYYRLTFDANGGEGGIEQRYLPGETITPPTVTRTGYNFLNWLIEEDGYRIPYEITVMPAEDITLYAEWEPISYMIPLHANVGVLDIVVNEIAGIECDERGIAWMECWYDDEVPLPGYVYPGLDSQYRLAGWNTRPDGSGVGFGRADIVRNLQTDGYGYDLYAQWKPRTEFGLFDAMYTLQRRAFGYDDATGMVTDAIYDASVAADGDGMRPVLDYGFELMYFRLQRTLDPDNPVSLYLYQCPDYSPGYDFTGNPLVPYDQPDPGWYSYPAPEGSLIGSGNNDGLTEACKTSMQENPVSFGRDWTKGLVTVGNITKLLADNNGNPGFVFTGVNGVSYFFSGKKLYEYGMDYHYENEDLEFTVTNTAPDMADIEAIAVYLPGPDPMMG